MRDRDYERTIEWEREREVVERYADNYWKMIRKGVGETGRSEESEKNRKDEMLRQNG